MGQEVPGILRYGKSGFFFQKETHIEMGAIAACNFVKSARCASGARRKEGAQMKRMFVLAAAMGIAGGVVLSAHGETYRMKTQDAPGNTSFNQIG